MSAQSAGTSGTLPLSDGYLVMLDTGMQQINLGISGGPGPASSVQIENISAFYLRVTLNQVTNPGISGDLGVLVRPGGRYQVSYDSNVINDLVLQLVNLPPFAPGVTQINPGSFSPVTSGSKGEVIVIFA
jgi:hypothetical protein